MIEEQSMHLEEGHRIYSQNASHAHVVMFGAGTADGSCPPPPLYPPSAAGYASMHGPSYPSHGYSQSPAPPSHGFLLPGYSSSAYSNPYAYANGSGHPSQHGHGNGQGLGHGYGYGHGHGKQPPQHQQQQQQQQHKVDYYHHHQELDTYQGYSPNKPVYGPKRLSIFRGVRDADAKA